MFILELIGAASVGGGTMLAALTAKRKLSCIAPDEHGAFPWLFRRRHGDWGFDCPKCLCIRKNTVQPPFCDCMEYHKHHFHFKCADCGFQSIMRTADDK